LKRRIAALIALDAISSIVSVVSLGLMGKSGEEAAPDGRINFESVMKSTCEGRSYVFSHPFLKFLFLLVAVAGFAFAGPVMVGIPYLANTRFPAGVTAYGIILSRPFSQAIAGLLLCWNVVILFLGAAALMI
jgi:hypothetical protein